MMAMDVEEDDDDDDKDRNDSGVMSRVRFCI